MFRRLPDIAVRALAIIALAMVFVADDAILATELLVTEISAEPDDPPAGDAPAHQEDSESQSDFEETEKSELVLVRLDGARLHSSIEARPDGHRPLCGSDYIQRLFRPPIDSRA